MKNHSPVKQMTTEKLAAMMRYTQKVPGENRLDVELSEQGSFRLTEVRPDHSVARCFLGHCYSDTRIGYAEEPDLTLTQLQTHAPILQDFLRKMQVAEEQHDCDAARREQTGEVQEKPVFQIVQDGEYPSLFLPLDHAPDNIAGNVRPEMLPVWFSLENMMEQHLYQTVKRRVEGSPWEIWARPMPLRLPWETV